MNTFGFLKVFGPYLVIVALLMAFLYMRGDKIKADGQRDAAVAEATQLRKINEQNAKSLDTLSKASADNARIAGEVSAKVDTIRNRGNTARTAVQEAIRNDPTVRDWANQPVPSGVRDALKGR